MNNLLNTAQQFILVKDLRDTLDWSLINHEFNSLTFKPNVNNRISTTMNLLDKDVFVDAKLILESEVKNYLNLSFGLSELYSDIHITNSWGTLTEPGQSHHDHLHPFSVVSGVMFLDNNPDNLNLFIEGHMPQIPYFISKNKSYAGLEHLLTDTGHDPAQNRNLQNHLVLFLSNSSHFVQPTRTDGPLRRTLSFNTFWKGVTGMKNEPLGSYNF